MLTIRTLDLLVYHTHNYSKTNNITAISRTYTYSFRRIATWIFSPPSHRLIPTWICDANQPALLWLLHLPTIAWTDVRQNAYRTSSRARRTNVSAVLNSSGRSEREEGRIQFARERRYQIYIVLRVRAEKKKFDYSLLKSIYRKELSAPQR